MKKKLAVYVGINLLIWIMLLFVPTVSSYIYEKINRTYDFQPLGYLYLYEGIIVILLNLSSALVFLAGRVRLGRNPHFVPGQAERAEDIVVPEKVEKKTKKIEKSD